VASSFASRASGTASAAGRAWVAGVTTDRTETSIPAASIASTRPWPMSSSRAWLSLMVLKATLSSRSPPGRRSSASRMLALFQCSSIAMIFIVMSFRVQVFECEPWRYHRTV
jgi:hypothetical protein